MRLPFFLPSVVPSECPLLSSSVLSSPPLSTLPAVRSFCPHMSSVLQLRPAPGLRRAKTPRYYRRLPILPSTAYPSPHHSSPDVGDGDDSLSCQIRVGRPRRFLGLLLIALVLLALGAHALNVVMWIRSSDTIPYSSSDASTHGRSRGDHVDLPLPRHHQIALLSHKVEEAAEVRLPVWTSPACQAKKAGPLSSSSASPPQLPSSTSPRLLIHVPVHSRTPPERIASFLHSAFLHSPFHSHSSSSTSSTSTYSFDLLFVISGANVFSAAGPVASAVSSSSTLLNVSMGVEASGGESPHLLVDCVSLAVDKYDKQRSSEDWVAGPNGEFYSVMKNDGELFLRHTRHYQFVLQMETDVYTFGDGWLSRVMEAVTESKDFVILGARLPNNSLVCDPSKETCDQLSDQPEYIRMHINGNALYRIDQRLQVLFNHSLTVHRPWPFDLALWLSAKDLGQESLLFPSPYFFAAAQPISTEALLSKANFVAHTGNEDAVIAHIGDAMQVSPLLAELSFMNRSLPITLTFVSASHLEYLTNLVLGLQLHGVRNVLIVAFDEESYLYTKQQLPSFLHVLRNLTANEQGPAAGSTAFKSASWLHLVNARQAVVTDILGQGFGVVCVDTDLVVLDDYLPWLLSMSQDKVYFSADGVGSVGYQWYNESTPRYHFNAGVFYIPQAYASASLPFFLTLLSEIQTTNKMDQDALNDLVKCDVISVCTHPATSVRIGVLDPSLYYNGGNFWGRRWPSTAHTAKALMVHGNWVDGIGAKRFRFQYSNMWPSSLTSCPSVTAMKEHDEGALLGGPVSVRQFLSNYLSFFDYIRQEQIACALVPSFRLWGTDIDLTFDVVFEFGLVRDYTRGAQLLPSMAWVNASDSGPVVIFTPPTQNYTLPPPMDWMLTAQVLNVCKWVHNAVGGNRVCVDDLRRSAAEVAVLALREGQLLHLFEVASRTPDQIVFIAGQWRVLHSYIDHHEAVPPNLRTSLSALVYPHHERMTYGLPFTTSRPGMDVLYDVIDAFVCSASTTTVQLSEAIFPLWDTDRLMLELAQHVPEEVLQNDIQTFVDHRSVDEQRALLSQPLMFGLDSMAYNGLSNRLGSLQTLLYLSETLLHRSVALPPFIPTHNEESVAPWSEIMDAASFYGQFKHAVPCAIALFLHPTVIFEALLDDAQFPLQAERTVTNTALLEPVRSLLTQYSRVTVGRSFRRVSISRNAEQIQLSGGLAIYPEHPYLGVTDQEAQLALVGYAGVDLAFTSAFRGYRFSTDDSAHLRFANAWRQGFTPSEAVKARVAMSRSKLPPSFACVHLRLKEEFLVTHQGQEHGDKERVLSRFYAYLQTEVPANVTAVYLAMDVDLRSQLKKFRPKPSKRIYTCFDFGCAPNFGDDAAQGVIDGSICAGAEVFRGNIFSSYSLAICGRRGDHLCLDLFGRQLTDQRVLM